MTALLHRHGALSFWDYAAAGPHCHIDMNPHVEGFEDHLVAKDAVFVSPHKFPGGPSTPGILVHKRRVSRNTAPGVPGGGSVFFVTESDHVYLEDYHREEAGTPNILSAIRAGLVFKLHKVENLSGFHWLTYCCSLSPSN